MSAALLALFARSHVLSVGTNSVDSYGFGAGFGSLTPSSVFGQTIITINNAGPATANDLLIQISGSHALGGQSFFTRVHLKDPSGEYRVFDSSTATYSNVGGNGQWNWGSGSFPVFSTFSGTRIVQFTR
jgi:hypothetical protein